MILPRPSFSVSLETSKEHLVSTTTEIYKRGKYLQHKITQICVYCDLKCSTSPSLFLNCSERNAMRIVYGYAHYCDDVLKASQFYDEKKLVFPSLAKLSISKRAKGIFNFLIGWEWENVFPSVKRESIKECFRRYWQFIFIGSKQLVGVFRSSETFKLQRNILHFPPIFCSRFDINIPRSFWSLRKFNFDLKRFACFCRERKIKLKLHKK